MIKGIKSHQTQRTCFSKYTKNIPSDKEYLWESELILKLELFKNKLKNGYKAVSFFIYLEEIILFKDNCVKNIYRRAIFKTTKPTEPISEYSTFFPFTI
jgi:hypothetical protein